ncbi:hypothetical protein CEV33_0448 [Brucella grignonensis]|uniref:Uncharacterized protein n=1 Tax=Brucella grignonensis TaxID=94627 RepID=A0A256FGS0_9HYPH|nr:hypothetical protein CEV33_0448 [Brucella grignonensis]
MNFVLRLSHISALIRIYIDLRQENTHMQAHIELPRISRIV